MEHATKAYGGRRLARIVLFAVICGAGCATFTAPFSVAPDSRESSEASPESPPSKIGLEAVEGRPDALVLRLTSTFQPPPEGRLEVRRRVGTSDPQTIRTVDLSPDRSRQLAATGLEFLDRAVEAGTALRYRLLYFRSKEDEAPTERSSIVRVDWHEPPPRPTDVRARADTPRLVELRWSPTTFGALIFRRNVLKRDAPTERIAAVSPGAAGVLVDRDVEPGAVYTYRIALSRERGSFTQYGAPSQPLYVSVPEK